MTAEAALATALLPALGKIAGSAAASVGKLSATEMTARLHDRRLGRLTRETGPSYSLLQDSLREIDAAVASGLVAFMKSPDLATLCLSLATAFASRGAKSSQTLIEGNTYREQLDATLAKFTPRMARARRSILSSAVYSAILTEVARAVAELREDGGGGKQSESAVVLARIAGNMASAAVRETEIIRKAESIAEYEAFAKMLRRQIAEAHANMRLPHAGTTKRVPYSALFVEPRMKPEQKGKEPLDSLTCVELLLQSHSTIVLGNPGGGKSTLSIKLTHDIAKDKISEFEERVPFLLVLREYADGFQRQRSTLVSHIEALCRSPYNIEPPSGAVEYLLLSGRAFVILDGLDELVDVSLRRQLVESIESFASLYPAAPILVTSRRVGYDEAPLDSQIFNAVLVDELNDKQVEEYAQKWFALDEDLLESRRRELAEAFILDSKFVADLRRNPLMLSLMCGIYASEHYIPANRPDVYKRCAELLFEKWDKQRGIVTPLPFDAHVKLAVNALAYWILSTGRIEAGLERAALVEFFTHYLMKKRFDDEAEAENAANQFVDFCTGRSWVLTNMGSSTREELYGFTHRTFLEYFAANQLVRLNTSAERLFGALGLKIAAAEWDVVGQLSLQILSSYVEDGADDFLELVISESQEPSKAADAYNLLGFASRSLEFIVPRPALISRISSLAVSITAREGGSLLDALYRCSDENFPILSREVTSSIRHELTSNERPAMAITLARHLGMSDREGVVTLGARDGDWLRLRDDRLLDIMRTLLSANRSRGAHWALEAALWGVGSIREVIEENGVGVLFERPDYVDTVERITPNSYHLSFIQMYWVSGHLRPQWRPSNLDDCINDLKDCVELFDGLKVDPDRDNQSIVLLLHEYLTAQRPFDINVLVILSAPFVELGADASFGYATKYGRSFRYSDIEEKSSTGKVLRFVWTLCPGAKYYPGDRRARKNLDERARKEEVEAALAGLSQMGLSPKLRTRLLEWASGSSSFVNRTAESG